MSKQAQRTADSGARRHGLKQFFSDDSMSVALFGLFLVCLVGQALTGWFGYNHDLRASHLPGIGFPAYLATGTFLDGMFSNWQAAVLQIAVLISFSAVLRQQGAAHSKKNQGGSHRKRSSRLRRRPTSRTWLQSNGLALAFFGLFVVTFGLHALFGSWKHNEDQTLRHLPASSFGAYVGSPGFWFSVFQCWEAEFVAIGVYVVLSIFLRQEGSPESKPMNASNAVTGETNH